MLRTTFALAALALLGAFAWANWPTLHALPPGTVANRILVEKSQRKLTLLRDATVLKEYSVSLGKVPAGAKEREGDQKTPEGIYRITEHKLDSSFYRALRVSYPEARDIERAKKAGVPPGSDIMVHGMKNGLGLIGRFHRFSDWTAGCIALTNSEIEEILAAVPNGTVIEIRP